MTTHALAKIERQPTTIAASYTPYRYVAVCECGQRIGPCGSGSAARARKAAKDLHARHQEYEGREK